MMDETALTLSNDVINFAQFVVSELRASSPYRTGNMQRSISLVNVDGKYIDIVIAVDYASYVNEQEKHKSWIQNTIDRCARAYAQNVHNDIVDGFSYEVLYGQ